MATLIIGLGHRARQGKDSLSDLINEKLTTRNRSCVILHWADALKNEVTNADRKYPLITLNSGIFHILNHPLGAYDTFPKQAIPELFELFEKRKIDIYWGMDEKDSEILQWWGTNYRRNFYGDDYWVDRLTEKINNLTQATKLFIVLIPDTRFKNELKAIKDRNGFYIDIRRLLPDGTQYLCKDRNPNHKSERDLDGVAADMTFDILDKDLDALNAAAEKVIDEIIDKESRNWVSI